MVCMEEASEGTIIFVLIKKSKLWCIQNKQILEPYVIVSQETEAEKRVASTTGQ